MKKNFLLMVVLGMLIVQSIFGEEKTIILEQTVVSAESFGTSSRKMAKNIRIITKKEIEETGALTVEDSLKGVPGVIIRKLDGAPPIIDLRGSGMASSLTSTLLLLNGVPLSGIRSFDINSIPVSEIEKIEIIQGGGALMYGDGAAGGIVNIITQPLKNKKYYGKQEEQILEWGLNWEKVFLSKLLIQDILLWIIETEHMELIFQEKILIIEIVRIGQKVFGLVGEKS